MFSIINALIQKLKHFNETEEDKQNQLIRYIREHGGFVGENVNIYDSNIDIAEPYLLEIGDNTTITGARIMTHDASPKKRTGYSKIAKVSIGKNCFIGWGSIILCDTKIGDNCIVGAGCVVAKDVPDNCVIVGNPMKILCKTDEFISKIETEIKNSIVIDKYPPEIVVDKQLVTKLKEVEKGFTL